MREEARQYNLRPLSTESAQAWATRKNQRIADRHPLFAAAGALDELGIAPVTPEQLIRANEAYGEQLAQSDLLFIERAAAFRGRVAQLVSAEELEALDLQREKLPKSPAYGADHWRSALKVLGGDV